MSDTEKRAFDKLKDAIEMLDDEQLARLRDIALGMVLATEDSESDKR